MSKFYLLQFSFYIFILGIIAGCGYIEDEYEFISEDELRKTGIEVPFPSRWDTFNYDKEGNLKSSNDVLRGEGYKIEQRYGEIKEVIKNGKSFKFSTKLKSTHLSKNFVIFSDGNTGIEDGFFRYFLRPIHSRLNTFERETFELLDQRVIHGVIRNVIIVDEFVYFHVADYRDEGFYGRYRIAN